MMHLRQALVFAGVIAAVAVGCATGKVTDTSPPESDAGPSCGAGSAYCGDTCTALDRDPQNCGACGKACKPDEVCSKGSCKYACGTGTSLCNAVCVDQESDPQNCGLCGHTCNPGEVCSAGKCGPSCGGGTTDCNGACVSTDVDRANCGACGTVCGDGEECVSGKCQLTCQTGLTMCPNDYPDAGAPDAGDAGTLGAQVCVDPWIDRFNCGGCGTTCPSDKPLCRYGQCQASCQATKCQQGGDVTNANLKWVVCQADCTTAWVSMLSTNGGSYHAEYICKQLGYNKLGAHGGTCGNVCGYCQSTTSCSSLGNATFDNGGTSCGSDQYGQILCQTVMWQCTM